MHTLHDFMLLTKGQEYLIAVLFVLVFIVFWGVLDKRRERGSTRK